MIRKNNAEQRKVNQAANNPQISHIPLPGGSVYSPTPKPNFSEIQERMEKESAIKREEFESKNQARAKKANILKRVNCQIKNFDGEEKKNNWKQREDTFGFAINNIDSENKKDTNSDIENENKWQKKAGKESFMPVGEISDEKIMQDVFKPKPIPARSKWGAKKETLVQKLDDLTLQQVILEDNSISPEKSVVSSQNKTRVVSGESNNSSNTESSKNSSSNLSPIKPLNKTPKSPAKEISDPKTPTKSSSLEIIDLQPVKTSGTPTMGSPVKPATPIKSPLVVEHNSDSDVDSIASNTTETVGAAEEVLKNRSHDISRIDDEDENDEKENQESVKTEPESNTLEEEEIAKITVDTLKPEAKRNILDILGAGDATISKAQNSDKTPTLTSDSENDLYESDFDASSSTDFEESQNDDDTTIDETKYFEESKTENNLVTTLPQSESLLHSQNFNSIQYPSPAKPHETSSIFEALECLRIELETALGFETFCEIYSLLEANEDEPPLDKFTTMLGKEKFETYYPKIFKLFMNDGIYYDQ